jgi:glutamate carboxypeptidase
MRHSPSAALAAAFALAAAPLGAQTLTGTEVRMRDWVRAHEADQVALLQRVVDLPSGTLNVAGVRRVGDAFAAQLDSLGFRTRWAPAPAGSLRAGHLVAEHVGRKGRARVLLIGHLDTVFEGEGQRFSIADSTARGAGVNDMKGGDVAIVFALKALQAAGALKDANLVVVMTGDEESAGEPLAEARAPLVEQARRSDAALAFEGDAGKATVARRGASVWDLTVTGKQAHSGGIFGEGTGYGAIYEAARILDGFRTRLAGRYGLTYSPGVIVGGTAVAYDSAQLSGTASGKLNIVARRVRVSGDLRFLSPGQLDSARATMREVVAAHLPGTDASIAFQDEYPSMAPTPGNYALLAAADSVTRALGQGPLEALDPALRGGGDASFVAAYLPVLDGLGARGSGAHTPEETLDVRSLTRSAERAAVLIGRLTRGKGSR